MVRITVYPGRSTDMTSNHNEALPHQTCTVCAELRTDEWASQKYGWEENDTSLPAAAGRLVVVRDFKPHSSRLQQLRQCPECGTYYLYETDYEYLVNGSEDEQHLHRLTPAEAAAYLDLSA
jgi:hypothetical protein